MGQELSGSAPDIFDRVENEPSDISDYAAEILSQSLQVQVMFMLICFFSKLFNTN